MALLGAVRDRRSGGPGNSGRTCVDAAFGFPGGDGQGAGRFRWTPRCACGELLNRGGHARSGAGRTFMGGQWRWCFTRLRGRFGGTILWMGQNVGKVTGRIPGPLPAGVAGEVEG